MQLQDLKISGVSPSAAAVCHRSFVYCGFGAKKESMAGVVPPQQRSPMPGISPKLVRFLPNCLGESLHPRVFQQRFPRGGIFPVIQSPGDSQDFGIFSIGGPLPAELPARQRP